MKNLNLQLEIYALSFSTIVDFPPHPEKSDPSLPREDALTSTVECDVSCTQFSLLGTGHHSYGYPITRRGKRVCGKPVGTEEGSR